MTWVDGLLLLLAAACVVWEIRLEAGRGLMDCLATLGAIAVARALAPAVTAWTHLPAHPGSDVSGWALLLAFVPVWLVLMALAWVIHVRTRWSMEQGDLYFGAVFGLILAGALGHFACDVSFQLTLGTDHQVPGALRDSLLAEELRSFRSVHFVWNTMYSASHARQ